MTRRARRAVCGDVLAQEQTRDRQISPARGAYSKSAAPVGAEGAKKAVAELLADSDRTAANSLKRLLEQKPARQLIEGIADGSPFLWGLIREDPKRLAELLDSNPESHLAGLIARRSARRARGRRSSGNDRPRTPADETRSGAADRARRHRRRVVFRRSGAILNRDRRGGGGGGGGFSIAEGASDRPDSSLAAEYSRHRRGLRRARHGKARRRRAELFQRYRSHRSVRSESAACRRRRAESVFRQAHARPRAAPAGTNVRRIRISRRPSSPPGSRIDADRDRDRRGLRLLRAERANLGAGRLHQGARDRRRYRRRRKFSSRAFPLRLAALSRSCRDCRHSGDEAPDPRLSRPWRDRGRRPQHQASVAAASARSNFSCKRNS